MTNPNNFTKLTGRLTADPLMKISTNGKTATVFITLAVQNNFKTKGEYRTNFIQLQKIISTKAQIHYHKKFKKGDTAQVICNIETNSTKNKEYINFVINSIELIAKVKPFVVQEQTTVTSVDEKTASQVNNESLLAEKTSPF